MFFCVTAKTGDGWTARDFMSLAYRGGVKNLPVGFSVHAFSDKVIEVNGDRFVRTNAAENATGMRDVPTR